MNAGFWDDRFRGRDYAYGREPNDFLRAEVARIPAGPVLCLAEGEGRNAVFLARRGHVVTAVDQSIEGLRKTEALAREHGVFVQTVQADLASYAPSLAPLAAIVAIFAHLPPPVRRRVHGWVPHALISGGVFILEAYSPAQLALNTGGPREPSLLMTLAELRSELAPLDFDVGREVQRDIHEGKLHDGPSATVQIVGVRR